MKKEPKKQKSSVKSSVKAKNTKKKPEKKLGYLADHQFKKGKSGNPKGRPKGLKNYKTLLEETMIEVAIENEWFDEDGKPDKARVMRMIMKKQIDKSLDGSVKHMADMYDRAYGKARTNIQAEVKMVGSAELDARRKSLRGMMANWTEEDKE